MNYTTGQKFKAKIQRVPVEGKIYVLDERRIFLLQNIFNGYNSHYISEMMGYKYGWAIQDGNKPALDFNDVTDLILLPDTSFDKDNWVVDIVKEKDHPRMGEFKEWMNARNREIKMCEFQFLFRFYGIINGKVSVLSERKEDYPNTISLDTFFTHFCKETTEPQKGDIVEVSDDGEVWVLREYTGFTYKNKFIVYNHVTDECATYKHIRLAKSPEQSKHEEAEKKAREFIESKGLLPNASPIYTLTEYIKTEK